MKDPFRSARLIYRAVESPEDDAFFLSMAQDYEAVANADATMLKPAAKKFSEERRKYFTDKALLGVLICLPAPSSNSTTTTTTDDAASSPKPIPIGRIHLSGSAPGLGHHRNSSIGIGIAAPYQRQGYGGEAIEWILRWGFLIAGLHRIEIGCFGWNEGAGRLYERLGFTPEGRKREAIWFDGGFHDTVEFSMLEHEWRAKQNRP
ncbi:hypothetical protein MMC08_001595 [Hypocenomyce scalaris]|nr:hypothetical protein [Hypocenomyce scalaris]